jgi:hypothetical protein
LVEQLIAAGDLEVNSSGVYRFLPGAWDILNEMGFYLAPAK